MESITFEEVIKDFLNYCTIKKKRSTYETYLNRINKYILPYVKGKNIYEFNSRDYLNWQMSIEKLGFKYNYKSSLHYCFTDILNYCTIFYNLNENIAKKVGNFKNTELDNIGNIWTYEEYKKFINKVDDKVYKVLFELLFFTGLRKGEALALTFNDIDFINNKISVNKTITKYLNSNNEKIINRPKTNSSIRIISIDETLKEEIEELKNYYSNFNNSMFVFGGNNSISFTTLTRKKDYYCNLANVKRIKIHEFRHSHACLLFRNEVPVDEISFRLGHAKLSMTMDTYLKYIPKQEKRVISTLNSLRLN